MSNRNKLYNYLVNTFGLSKDVIMKQAEERIEDVMNKHLQQKLQSNNVERMILNQVSEIVKNGFSSRDYWSRVSFEDYVKSTIKSVITQQINDTYELEVKINRKSTKTMGEFPNSKD